MNPTFIWKVENQKLGNENFKKKIGKKECFMLDCKSCLKDRMDKSLVQYYVQAINK